MSVDTVRMWQTFVLLAVVSSLNPPAFADDHADLAQQNQDTFSYYSLERKTRAAAENDVRQLKDSGNNMDGRRWGDKNIEPEDLLSLLEGCATVFKPADNQDVILSTMSVKRCVTDCRNAGYQYAAIGRCFTALCIPEGTKWRCRCNHDGITAYADPADCDETCPDAADVAHSNMTKSNPPGDEVFGEEVDEGHQGQQKDELILPCGGTKPGFMSVYATSQDYLLGGTTEERIESEGTSLDPLARFPTMTCVDDFDQLNLGEIREPNVDSCCSWKEPDFGTAYSVCALSQRFWDVTWEQEYAPTVTPNFPTPANQACIAVAGGNLNASLYYLFPDQMVAGVHEKVAARVKTLMQGQENGSKNSRGSVMTAGGGLFFNAEGLPFQLKWYLPNDDFISLDADEDICQIVPGDEICNEGLVDTSECYTCRYPEHYASVPGYETYFSFSSGTEFFEVMNGLHLPLGFSDFSDGNQPDPWPLHAIGAKKSKEEPWQWDEDRTPWFILCQWPESADDHLTTSTTEWFQSTDGSLTSLASLETTAADAHTSTVQPSSPEPSTDYYPTSTYEPNEPGCKTPEDSVAFLLNGFTEFTGVLKTDCPQGWWGKLEMLQCKRDDSVIWKKRCSPFADWNLLFELDVASVTEKLETLSEIISGREGNITGEDLLSIIETLDPFIEDFIAEVAQVSDPIEAFQMADNFTQGFLSVADEVLDQDIVWEQYDPQEANATAASSKLLNSLDRVGGILANQLPIQTTTSHKVDSRNVLMGVTKNTGDDIIIQGNHTLYFPDENNESYIKIPAGYHTLLPMKSKDGTFKEDVKTVGLLVRKTEEAVFPGKRNVMGKSAKKKQVNSNILGFRFIVGDNEVPLKLDGKSEPITVVFKNNLKAQAPFYDTIFRSLHPGEKPTAIPDSGVCSFLQPENDVTWSKEGCFLKTSTEGRTVCECYHLTNFAVLMDVHGYVGKNLGLEVMGYVIGGLSVICLAINFSVFQFIDGAKTPTAVLTKHLSLTLLLGHVIMSAAFDKTYFVMSDVACSLVAAAVHYLFLSSFCWMLLEGYVLYIRLVHIFQAEQKIPRWKYLGFGYLAPLVVVGFTYGLSAGLGHDGYGRGEYCWLRSPDYIWSFAGPVMLIILTNASFMTLALRSARTGLKQATAARRQSLLSLKGCMSLCSILGLGWFLGYLYVVHSPIFAYMFTLLNASQGIWIFLFHVFLNDAVSTALRRYLERRKTIGDWSTKSFSATNRALEILENPIFNKRGRRTTKDHSGDNEFNSRVFGRDSASTRSTRVNGDSFPERRGMRDGVVNPGFSGPDGETFGAPSPPMSVHESLQLSVIPAEVVSPGNRRISLPGYDIYSSTMKTTYQPVYGNRWNSAVKP